jgi:hypothetical protein
MASLNALIAPSVSLCSESLDAIKNPGILMKQKRLYQEYQQLSMYSKGLLLPKKPTT